MFNYWYLAQGKGWGISAGLSRWAFGIDFDQISISVWFLNLEFYWRFKRLPGD